MHRIDPVTDESMVLMDEGVAAFRKGVGIHAGPHEGARGTTWESGWLNAMQAAVLGMRKKPQTAPKPKAKAAPKKK